MKASVDAIEARDPTTSGHSRRVADLTVNLANAVERTDTGPYREVRWQREDLREIEYASVLHDFGKIGVREHVLVKAKKLFPHELGLIRQRFEFVIRTIEVDVIQRKMIAMSHGASSDELAALDRELAAKRAEIEEAWSVIEQANEPHGAGRGQLQAHRRAGPASLCPTERRRIDSAQRRRGQVAERDARLAHRRRIRRDPQSRVAHVPLLVPDPVGQDLLARRRHRRFAPRALERHRLPQSPASRRHPRCNPR